MLHFLAQFADNFQVFNLFRYITFRTGGAVLTSLLIVFAFGPAIIKQLKIKQKKGQPIREDGPKAHLLTKKGTPTMGGLMILVGISASTLLWADLTNIYVWVVLGVTLGFAAIGFYDDYLKVSKISTKGFSGRKRLSLEFLIAGIACVIFILIGEQPLSSSVAFPFFKDLLIDLSWFFIAFGAFVIVSAGNAVNLTDGLDGLAIVPVMIAAATFGLITYMTGNAVFANYLDIHFVKGVGELAVICGAVIGASLGFLWFNAPPAQVFMGDTGSLALGGLLGAVAVATKHEIVLAITGGLFVMEAVSVIIQVLYFKWTGKRILKMAPMHHHFEHLGWSEPQIVMRFWIIAVILAIISLGTLKLR